MCVEDATRTCTHVLLSDFTVEWSPTIYSSCSNFLSPHQFPFNKKYALQAKAGPLLECRYLAYVHLITIQLYQYPIIYKCWCERTIPQHAWCPNVMYTHPLKCTLPLPQTKCLATSFASVSGWTSSHVHTYLPTSGHGECWTLTSSLGRIPAVSSWSWNSVTLSKSPVFFFEECWVCPY